MSELKIDERCKSTLKKIILFCTVLFLVSVVGAYILARGNWELIEAQIAQMMEGVMDNLNIETNKNFGLSLFINNLRAVSLMILTGFIPFLFIPIFILVLNGIIIGALPMLTGTNFVSTMVFGILPHGIFELSAIILGASFGVMICLTIVRKIIGKNTVEFKILLKYILKKYVFVIIPLLVIAAIVEAYITPIILMNTIF
ncbi:stage II sporulation protein M [Anaerosphaera aminiphila DSM 21120]|uniref:Stage II sporulation protein M n=1 Tax=Anaerosphaera aminiphila DSM 21120 TaxID=1120995 RepID=A0A1M5R3M1_9FIRM|nr:stage II sporulation protein M [Anaerosphaera aminiphila]SHH20801.1 stage II sporulation protein M [Anaerosphaera aminiphila DSM 21120]